MGEDRESHITARKYDPDTGKTSSFEWMAGDELLLQKNDIGRYKSFHSQYADASETDKKWEELLDRCTVMMTEENMDEKTGQVKAEALLAELGMDGKIYAYSEPALWFPSGTYEEDIAFSNYDSLWNADLSQAEPGYVYTFLNEVGGMPVDMQYGGVIRGTGESEAYAPAISVETVSVAVTRSGIKMFSWTGMAKEVSVVAENVKIQEFEKTQERIRQYISYCFPEISPWTVRLCFTMNWKRCLLDILIFRPMKIRIMCGQSRRGSWNLEPITRNRSWTEGRKRRLLPGFL